MARANTASLHSPRATRGQDVFAGARVLLVDGEADRLVVTRRWLEARTGVEAEWAASADEALDVIGAARQQFDGVVVWPWLPDSAEVDLPGVLRRCQSPLRLMAATAQQPEELGRAGRLAGVAVVDEGGLPSTLAVSLAALLASGDRVADIVQSRRAPLTLSPLWAGAIYGTGPGHRFHAPLD